MSRVRHVIALLAVAVLTAAGLVAFGPSADAQAATYCGRGFHKTDQRAVTRSGGQVGGYVLAYRGPIDYRGEQLFCAYTTATTTSSILRIHASSGGASNEVSRAAIVGTITPAAHMPHPIDYAECVFLEGSLNRKIGGVVRRFSVAFYSCRW